MILKHLENIHNLSVLFDYLTSAIQMIDILLVPIRLVIVLVMIHAYFGMEILERGIIFTDLAIAQFAALGSSISLGYFHEKKKKKKKKKKEREREREEHFIFGL